MDELPVGIPVNRTGVATSENDHVVRDVALHFRSSRDVERPSLGHAVALAQKERVFDNADALDDALLVLATTAMHDMRRLRESYPHLRSRHG